jgi:heme/copper-type cytochrome/quinol oxidase subunit 3
MEQPIATRREATGIPTGKLAVYWVIGSEILIFGGLIMCYLLFRLRNEEWGSFAQFTNVYAGGFNTLVLLTSSLFIVLAHDAAGKGESDKAFKLIWFTIFGGLIFMGVKAYEYTTEIEHGFTLFTNVFWSFYFIATGLHGAHVLGGMVIMAIISFDVKKKKNLHRVELIGLYWHFVDIVWIFLFPLLYIAK